MIRSFRDKGLRRFAETGDSSKLAVPHIDRLRRILVALDSATAPEQMSIPGLRLHRLQGQARGRWAVSASGNFRVTFGWDGQDAVDVDLEDYHR